MDDYPDGVWFVELAPLADERLVPQAVASVLRVKEEAGRPVTEALVKHVADRRLLLVLDNCEHLVQAVCSAGGATAPVERQSADSRIQPRAAARVRRGDYHVPALAVRHCRTGSPSKPCRNTPAVGLFVDRATAALPTFRLTEHNARAVAEICRNLDGIPLAIELAAARIRALSVENIAGRLNDCFRFLTGGNRAALPRQQTLRALIDWSHDLLTDKERILFRRLSVLAGGWTLEAAEAVCSGGDVGEIEVVGLLVDLVDKSLVMADPEGGRYRLLETVRQYANERLTRSEDGEATRSRHLVFFLDFAERVALELLGQEQAAAFNSSISSGRTSWRRMHGACALR
jgi:non-specific serine/threonine protein kinase